jgi:hypothetical protein
VSTYQPLAARQSELGRGSAGPDVSELNEFLRRYGWLSLPGYQPVVVHHALLPEADPDRFEDATEAALLDYQAFNGLPRSGVLDPATRELMQRPRCGVPDRHPLRPAGPENFALEGTTWRVRQLGFKLTQGTADLTDAQVISAVAGAYRKWCLVAPIVVHAVTHDPHIEVRFATGDHGDGAPFDGPGVPGTNNVLAHGFPPPASGDDTTGVIGGDLHFDDDETWTRDLTLAGFDLDSIALHEAGHTLGLDHSADADAVMVAYYPGSRRELGEDDILGIHKLYGTRTRNKWRHFDTAIDGQIAAYGKSYFFNKFQYLRYDWIDDLPDAGYPQATRNSWRDLPAGFGFAGLGPHLHGIDAALNGQGDSRGKLYLFRGNQYVRYDWFRDRMDPGYPYTIAAHWRGLPAEFTQDFDSAVAGRGPATGKAFFFKGSQYLRYDFTTDRADPGYPQPIASAWNGLPASFTSDIDATMNGGPGFEDKLYLFKGAEYVRYDLTRARADGGYPQPIEFNWL